MLWAGAVGGDDGQCGGQMIFFRLALMKRLPFRAKGSKSSFFCAQCAPRS